MDRKEAIEYWEEFLEEIPEIEGMPQEEKDKQEQATLMAIEALQEPERKKGQWIEIIKDERFGDEWDEIAVYKCSVCESEFVECMGTYNFCPNCGADMRGEQE